MCNRTAGTQALLQKKISFNLSDMKREEGNAMQACTLVSCELQQPDPVRAAHVLPESPLPNQRSQVSRRKDLVLFPNTTSSQLPKLLVLWRKRVIISNPLFPTPLQCFKDHLGVTRYTFPKIQSRNKSVRIPQSFPHYIPGPHTLASNLDVREFRNRHNQRQNLKTTL